MLTPLRPIRSRAHWSEQSAKAEEFSPRRRRTAAAVQAGRVDAKALAVAEALDRLEEPPPLDASDELEAALPITAPRPRPAPWYLPSVGAAEARILALGRYRRVCSWWLFSDDELGRILA